MAKKDVNELQLYIYPKRWINRGLFMTAITLLGPRCDCGDYYQAEIDQKTLKSIHLTLWQCSCGAERAERSEDYQYFRELGFGSKQHVIL